MVLTSTDLGRYYKLLGQGKVRDVYEIDAKTLLFVATDRISAFDVVLENGIPNKGKILTLMSRFWFTQIPKLLPSASLETHFISLDLPKALAGTKEGELYQDRSMQVKRLKVFPIESIVRGYITGSAWSEYKKSGTVHGINVGEGLQESQQFPTPLWTPSTKAEAGQHDENITPEQAAKIIGSEYANKIASLSVQIYSAARDYAQAHGIIIADTKFEFALDESTQPPSVVLVDEVLTPDSSRFWDATKYTVGRPQESLDKQFLRDWLIANGLKGKEGVTMPAEVAERTYQGYMEAYTRLTGAESI
ncbi:Phosphoribosylaminoimidazole-succinocarboxamide synthase [Eremomyces bilateralis CBS 781.70]|uniref:Phosphoribosylaminoimidazole-succinocarboxamide synthase n=1 Tax=Eremomyces bilateralis CBS 781.70 TaxID=1392243 RepID=A0A6G1G9T6_9PEZI|nr:Phosphoribosylaminoimidazole-succinocarboxamide synthase [Eremomyces bilateralis CBS 781.70]KAF1814847.1 Phosphoribosylaminoimidazole-succinocarboxamide synthase [Eremomyces bilateralis CBS 781.70]